MTEQRYLFEPEIHASARIIGMGNDGQNWVQLDQTWFHPQGGGQKSDRGSIEHYPVTHVAWIEGEIRHYLAASSDLYIGQQVELVIDEQWRLLNAGLHTAGHLLAALGEASFPGVRAVAGHHWPNEARVEFAGSQLPDAPVMKEVLSEVLTTAIDADPPLVISHAQGVRLVQIGEHRPVPCGGTHIKRIASLGKIALTKVKATDGRARVSYTLQ